MYVYDVVWRVVCCSIDQFKSNSPTLKRNDLAIELRSYCLIYAQTDLQGLIRAIEDNFRVADHRARIWFANLRPFLETRIR
jgi:hypothetical protein